MTINFVQPAADEKRIVERALTIAQLCLSPHNCRRSEPPADNTAPLEGLILGQGLRVPIEVHRMRGTGGNRAKFGAFAGRRRYYSIKRLVDRGDLPADHPIGVREYIGYSDAELVELSLSENFRQDLADHELYAGIARAFRLGHDVEQIARNLGFADAELVARWVRLGSLARPVFDALTTGEIDVARAKAYAATEDRTLQGEVFAQLRRPGLVHPPAGEIRRALKVGDRELERRLAFVGADEYQAAGGRYELNLFAEDPDQRGRVVDEGLLAELVRDKLDFVRGRVRDNVHSPNLRFIPEPPKNNIDGTDFTLQHRPREDGGAIALPEGVVAHIAIDDDGAAEVTYWWPSNAAKNGADRRAAPAHAAPAAPRPAPRPGQTLAQLYRGRSEGAALSTSTSSGAADPYEARRAANAQLKDAAGFTADLVEILRSQRRLILRARLVEEAERAPFVALNDAGDWLVWSQLRAKLASHRGDLIGAAVPPGVGDPPVTVAHLREMPADRIWRDALQELQGHAFGFLSEPDPAEAFLAFTAADDRTKRLATAVVAGLPVERSLNADGYRVAAHDALAQQLELDDDVVLRRLWTPTAAWLGLLPKAARAALVQPFVEAAAFAPWPRLPDAELTGVVLQVLAGTHPAIRPAARDAATTWVPDQLRFRPIGAGAADEEEEGAAAPADRQPEAVA